MQWCVIDTLHGNILDGELLANQWWFTKFYPPNIVLNKLPSFYPSNIFCVYWYFLEQIRQDIKAFLTYRLLDHIFVVDCRDYLKISIFFFLHYYYYSKSMPISIAGHVVIPCQLFACSCNVESRVHHLGHSQMPDRLKKETLVKSRLLKFSLLYTHGLLVYRCIRRVVVKS